MSLLKYQTLRLRTYNSSLVFTEVLRSDLTQEAGRIYWYFMGILLQVKTTTVSFHIISYECLSVEISDLYAIQHHDILCMSVQNTVNSRYISSLWKYYLAYIVP
jgi:hypothetical protein